MDRISADVNMSFRNEFSNSLKLDGPQVGGQTECKFDEMMI